LAYLRRTTDGTRFVVVLCNFTPVPRHDYRVGVPKPGGYSELLNSDWPDDGGCGSDLRRRFSAQAIPWHGQPWSISVTLPPMAALILKPDHLITSSGAA